MFLLLLYSMWMAALPPHVCALHGAVSANARKRCQIP